jgi:cell division protein FtsQ
LKKLNYKKILTTALWLLSVSAISLSLSFVAGRSEKVKIKRLSIEIENEHENFFVDAEEIEQFFASRSERLVGSSYNQISIPTLERTLNSHPAVQNAEVASTPDGELRISVTQRTPVMRVINKDGESYYIDSEGKFMPLDDNYSARVMVATGELFEPYARRSLTNAEQISNNETYRKISVLDDLYKVATHVIADSTLSMLIQQVYVNADQELELFPAVGNHRVVLGDSEDLNVKFNKLKLFYTEGLNKTNGWSKYSTINLKYKNLVVCTKK